MTSLRRCLPLALAALVSVACPPSASAQDATELRAGVLRPTTVSVDYGVTGFTDSTDPWHAGSLTAGRRGTRGSVFARANVARRFGSDGMQVEADAYPRLGSGLYAYLNIGYSADAIFPKWRSGGELFASLPRAYEASLGYRQLRFGGSPVTLFTGSVGKYAGDYWVSMRPYVRRVNGGTSASVGLTGRRYYEDGDHFIGARASIGSAPGDAPTADQVARTSSASASIQAATGLTPNVLLTWSAGFEREELAPGRTRTGVSGNAGLKYLF